MTPSGRRSTTTSGGPNASFVLVIRTPPATTALHARLREPCSGQRRSFSSYSHADGQIQQSPRHQKALVETIDRRCLTIAGNRKMQASPARKPVLNFPKYRLASPKSSAFGSRTAKDASTIASQPRVGSRACCRVEDAHADIAGDERGKLDPGPVANRELLDRQPAHKGCNLVARRLGRTSGARKLVSK